MKLMDDELLVNYIGQRTACPLPPYLDLDLNMSRTDPNMSLESVLFDNFISLDA